MRETISKSAVCEIIADMYPTDGENVVDVRQIDKAYEAIQQLSYAQPETDWDYSEETKQITLIVPEDVYNSAETIFLSVGYEGTFGIRGMVYSVQPSSSCAHENDQDLQQTCNQLATDYISRQAAIDALDGEIEITGRTNAEAVKGYVRLVKDRLERLPSAQPDLSSYSDKLWRNAYERGKAEAQAEIVRCKDCKWKQGAECVRFADVRPWPDDFCSRAERREE